VVLALDGELVAAGPGGIRTIPAASFFTGPYSTALAPDEILTEVRLPVWPGGHAFTEFSRIHANFAVVAVAALVVADGDRIRRASVTLAGMGPTPVRAQSAERALQNTPGDAEAIRGAARAAVADLSPPADLHASAETRLTLAEVYLRRGLELAVSRARNER
jgi:carbon-monoxide dehydrogenase medium subunit